ncbi:alpha-1,2-mannosidase family protein [Rutstroemia sp. NJR-2017a WRK4]|nr:alpha-1,2-mannosidase family protein [Rutstroemia sp. NJR-2017a WRK4]
MYCTYRNFTVEEESLTAISTGSQNGGNDFPGVARPWGMVKLGPDLLVSGTDSYSGYLPNGNFSGFSMMHEQGTGGAPKYGTVAQLPLVGHISNPLSNITVGRAVADTASVGYYHAQTSDNVIVELAATSHAGMYQYTFPSGSAGNNILVDVGHVVPSFRGQGLSQGYDGGGYFNVTPLAANVYSNVNGAGSVVQSSRSATASNGNTDVGGLFTFNTTAVSSRVGISWISIEKACQNVNNEIPHDTSFSAVVSGTKSAWNTKVLSKITTTSTDTTNLGLLYTSLYFMSLIPTNQTGENPGWSSTEPYYQDIFTLWDLFRCGTALFHVLQPTVYEEYIRSLIDIWRHDGYMPDARSSNYNGRTQGGSNADNVLADAYVKGVRGKVNWNDGYAAMVTDAETPPPNTSPPDPMAPDSSTKEGRGALPDWKKYGFITPTYSRAGSRAVDYAYNDFALYQVATGLGKKSDAAKYLARSRNWRNHWDANLTSIGYSGFIVPRTTSGFISVDPLNNAGYWGDPFYEGSSWQYSWGDIHDMATIVEYMGGDDTFYDRLETMFTVGANPSNPTGIIFDDTNEVTFNVPYLYNFINKQSRSSYQSRNIAKNYNLSPSGLPGNSDAGAMQTWLLWNMIGLYPITSTPNFLISSTPWFSSLSISLPNSKTLQITTTSVNSTASTDAIYIQSLKINSKPWTKNWVTWSDIFANGGTMEYVLGTEPSDWDKDGERPPSLPLVTASGKRSMRFER